MRIASSRIDVWTDRIEPGSHATTACARSRAVVSLVDAAGRVGRGECAPLPGYSPDHFEEAHAAIEAAVVRLRDRDLDDLVGATADVTPPSARFAIETAICDLAAQARSVSLAAFLAERTGRVDGPLTRLSVAWVVDDADEAAVAVARGVGTLKVKVGRDGSSDVHRLRAIRDRVGEGVRMRIDANGRLRHLADLDALAEAAPELVEEPFPVGEWPATLPLSREGPSFALAVDESLQSRSGGPTPAELWSRPGVRFAVLKPTALGGLFRCLALAHEARAHGVEPIVSHCLEGPVAFTACVHLALAVMDRGRAAGLGPHPGLGLGRPSPLHVVLALPSGPGLGDYR
jgi:O-succinylbenzoate synthase